ncbi:kinetochore-associated protein DSN1 homolog isoform X3 [Tupaia chinensis]|uniref:kinetochore-associated protein DSN1 homolog isoform X3 n=1 Tax=Tupaia chinensis TaxID=246437 RepID=UPI000FFC371D|nr:kinetochore-associated protein DSN1 homolog isoform X3 [Tupaia chinensis]
MRFVRDRLPAAQAPLVGGSFGSDGGLRLPPGPGSRLDGRGSESSPPRMTSVPRPEIVEEEEPVVPKTHDHQSESRLNPVEVFTESSTSLEMTQGISKERTHLGCTPKKGGSCDLNHQEELQSKSLRLSPQEQSACRQDRRQSWRRASMKETNRRKSLAPFHQGITASSLSEELKHFTDRLESDGTLQKCFEDSKGKAIDLSLEASVAEMKEYITKFSLERQTWDQLLLRYQKEAEEISGGSTETKVTEVKVEPTTYLGSSQSEVLDTVPDYQKMLQNQSRVFDCMELVMDELQGSVKQLQAFMDESTQCFQKVSVQLEKRSMQQLDPSPARKLLKLHLQKPSTTHCPGSCQ